MKIFNSIRVRLTLWHIGTIGLLILIFASTLYLGLKKTLERSIDIALRTAGEEIEHAFLENPYVSWDQILNEESEKELPISLMYIQIIEIPGEGKASRIIIKSETLARNSLPLS